MFSLPKKEGADASTREFELQHRSSSSGTGDTTPTQHDDEGKDVAMIPSLLPNKQDGEVEEPHLVNYVNMNWAHCGLLMIAECISLGVLSLPHAMAVLGLVR